MCRTRRIFFTGGDPTPNCAGYDGLGHYFHFGLKTSRTLRGTYTISYDVVIDGHLVNNHHPIADILLSPRQPTGEPPPTDG